MSVVRDNFLTAEGEPVSTIISDQFLLAVRPQNDSTLKDGSPMPWGRHKGVPMQDVPASYLFWLWTTRGKEHDKVCPVADYIRRNLATLRLEYRDGIW